MITFGAVRIVTEFFRDNYKVIKFTAMEQADGYIGISSLAIWAFLMMSEGIILFFIFKKINEKKEKMQLEALNK
jgi:prolipoprotein diacylglyceryltransferase